MLFEPYSVRFVLLCMLTEKRERERERQTDRQTDRQRERERERERERVLDRNVSFCCVCLGITMLVSTHL